MSSKHNSLIKIYFELGEVKKNNTLFLYFFCNELEWRYRNMGRAGKKKKQQKDARAEMQSVTWTSLGREKAICLSSHANELGFLRERPCWITELFQNNFPPNASLV